MKFFSVILSMVAFSQVSMAKPSAEDMAQYLDIQEVEHKLIKQEALEPEGFNFDLNQYIVPGEELTLTDIVNLGKQIWQIVKANEPVLNFKSQAANAIPLGAQSTGNLSNWGRPVANTYQMVFKNGFGSKVVTFTYKAIFTPGGVFNGTGQYLANVSVHPVEVNVSWGFKFNAEVAIENVVNTGSAENPVAGLQLNVNWRTETMVKKILGGEYYFVQGDGTITQL